MPYQADLSTDRLRVTEGSAGTAIADIDSSSRDSFILGKLSLGPPQLAADSTLEVKGALAVGAGYVGGGVTPGNSVAVEGSVGIGTKTPAAKLDVVGTMRVSQGAQLLGKVGIGVATPQNALDVEGALAVGAAFSGSAAAPANGLIVEGAVGIGTSAPGAKLDVDGGAFLGYETSVLDFGVPLKSGFYQNTSVKVTGDVPDTEHSWTHLIVARHSNTGNNHQLQIAASYATNDKLYFRKIATTGTANPAWNELATRGANAFSGNQNVTGNIAITGNAGIGTTGAAVKLAVGGAGANVYATDAWIENNIHVQGNEALPAGGRGRLRVGTAWGYVGIYAELGSGGANNDLVLGATSGRVRVGPDGSGQSLLVNGDLTLTGVVGAGTTTPARKLHVHSDSSTGNQVAEIHASGATAGFSFTDREAGRQFDNGGAGQRWVLYSSGRTARLWTPAIGDVMKVTSDGVPVFRNSGALNDARAKQILAGEPRFSSILGVEARGQGTSLVYYWKDGDGSIHKAWDAGWII